jgi:hypothetical protein
MPKYIYICLSGELICDVDLYVTLLHGLYGFGWGDMCMTVADIDILVLPSVNTSGRA